MPGAIQAMINGSRLDEALAETDFFPATFISSVSLGQEAGSLSDVLSKIVVLYETELELKILPKRLNALVGSQLADSR